MAAGKINLQKASGGITTITGVDGTGNTELVLPESGTVATTAGATETSTGLIELATTAETQAGTDDTRAITPLKLFNSLNGSNQSLLTNGYQKLHGGLIIQWGLATASSSADTPILFPMVFPNALFYIGGQVIQNTSNVQYVFTTEAETTSGFSFNSITVGGRNATPVKWLAIGY